MVLWQMTDILGTTGCVWAAALWPHAAPRPLVYASQVKISWVFPFCGWTVNILTLFLWCHQAPGPQATRQEASASQSLRLFHKSSWDPGLGWAVRAKLGQTRYSHCLPSSARAPLALVGVRHRCMVRVSDKIWGLLDTMQLQQNKSILH